MTLKKCGLRKALQIVLGAVNIKLTRAKVDWRSEFSGFFEDSNGQLFYVTATNQPLAGLSPVMYRTAKHRKDYTGGQNTWDFCRRLENAGYKLQF